MFFIALIANTIEIGVCIVPISKPRRRNFHVEYGILVKTAEELRAAMLELRQFFINPPEDPSAELTREFLALLKEVESVVGKDSDGAFRYIHEAEQASALRIGNAYRTTDGHMSARESRITIYQFIEAESPSEISDRVLSTLTKISFLRKYIYEKFGHCSEYKTKRFLNSAMELLSKVARRIKDSRFLSAVPNTPHGEPLHPDVLRVTAETLCSEYFLLESARRNEKFRIGLPGLMLDMALLHPIFEVFVTNFSRKKLLVPSDLAGWLSRTYPRHRRSMHAGFASYVDRNRLGSMQLRIALSNRHELEPDEHFAYSKVENLLTIGSHVVLQTNVLNGFPT